MSGPRLLLGAGTFALALGCQSLHRFDTEGQAAYCGEIVGAQFVRTVDTKGGFRRDLGMKLELDMSNLSTKPGRITTDDAKIGPCAPSPTFDDADLRVTPEVMNDALSSMEFEDGQVHNVIAWADSTCRGPMLVVASLYKNGRVSVRLLKSGSADPADNERDAFALFSLTRSNQGCGY